MKKNLGVGWEKATDEPIFNRCGGQPILGNRWADVQPIVTVSKIGVEGTVVFPSVLSPAIGIHASVLIPACCKN